MRKYLLLIIILSVFVMITSCDKIDVSKLSDKDLNRISKELIVCNSPYIRFASSCCLDKNNNSICDKDEVENITKETPKLNYEDECLKEFSQIVQSWKERFPTRQTDLFEFKIFNNKTDAHDYTKKWASKVVYLYDSYEDGKKIRKPTQTKLYNFYGYVLEDIKNLNDNVKEIYIGVIKMEEDKEYVLYNFTTPYACVKGSILPQSKKLFPNLPDSLS